MKQIVNPIYMDVQQTCIFENPMGHNVGYCPLKLYRKGLLMEEKGNRNDGEMGDTADKDILWGVGKTEEGKGQGRDQ